MPLACLGSREHKELLLWSAAEKLRLVRGSVLAIDTQVFRLARDWLVRWVLVFAWK